MNGLGTQPALAADGLPLADAIICSPLMHKLMQMVRRVARSNASVLITGETGSGKEFIARGIHYYSLRASQPWIDVNCATFPEHLVESELFGYERGAFSGAETSKPGFFELANNGTLFLDEIGEIPSSIQVKLLRVLDGMPYYRLGGSQKVSVNVRLVAATNRDLSELVASGRFRRDLYHRLTQFQLKVPALRERPEDLLALAKHFLAQQRPEAHFSQEAVDALLAYAWPGNIRELKNVVTHCTFVVEGELVTAADLPEEVRKQPQSPPPNAELHADPTAVSFQSTGSDLGQLEKQAILHALTQAGGHQGRASKQLGISRRTLSRRLKQYGLSGKEWMAKLGSMSAEEQQHYRADLAGTPVVIRWAGGQPIEAIGVNVSSGGVGVAGLRAPANVDNSLEVRLALPDGGPTVECKGTIVWSESGGRAGIRFVEMRSSLKRALERWLNARQQEEGWAS